MIPLSVIVCVSIIPQILFYFTDIYYNTQGFVGYLKGKSALMIHDRHPELSSKWNREFWARGYYVTTIGNVNEETIQKYIREQAEESKKEDTRK